MTPDRTPGRALRVEGTGPLATVQDLGRAGVAHLGVPRSGAADRAALRLANRLVGNREGAAALEVTLGGLAVRVLAPVLVALTGAACPALLLRRDRPAQGLPANAPVDVPAGALIRLGTATAGLRGYLAVRGGVDVAAVLGSRARDTLSGLGPPPLAVGQVLALGGPAGPDVVGWPNVDVAAVAPPPGPAQEVVLAAVPGPRAGWLSARSRAELGAACWVVQPDSNRVGVRLHGPALGRAAALRAAELPSEGLVRGAVQVPPAGQPVIFGADHPVTGGYPVVAVLRERACDLAAQLRPGQRVRLRIE